VHLHAITLFLISWIDLLNYPEAAHMKGFCPLASGSKGNSIFLGTKEAKILIDAGISAKALTEKLGSIGVGLNEIDAIIITHEHHDHISGLKTLAFKHGIPIFANHETAKGIVEAMHDCPKFKIFSTGETFQFLDLEIHPFSIQHDTLDPVAFTFKTDNYKIGFCADIGYVSNSVRRHLENCDYLYIEANHEPSMVHASSRPMVYKQRVLSRTGHLSNQECGDLIKEIAHPGLKHIHLAHLSSECNSPEVALYKINTILAEAGINMDISIAYQDKISRKITFD
jgi:phosphoribosyl 1,2-cyclic phosphodiesterase